jgi:hypothetical protein
MKSLNKGLMERRGSVGIPMKIMLPIRLYKVFEIDLKEYLISKEILPAGFHKINDWQEVGRYFYEKYNKSEEIEALMEMLKFSFQEDESCEDLLPTYYSVDIMRKKLLCIEDLQDTTKVDIIEMIIEFCNLTLSKSDYLNDKDSQLIIAFLNNYGFPFIPYESNINSQISNIIINGIAPGEYNLFTKTPKYPQVDYEIYPFESIKPEINYQGLLGLNILYHLEEFRRYQLFIKSLYHKKIFKKEILDEDEVRVLDAIFMNCMSPGTHKNSDEIPIYKYHSKTNYTLGYVLIILLQEIEKISKKIEDKLYFINPTKCYKCEKWFKVSKRQKKYVDKFPYCPDCENIVKNIIRNERMKADPKLKERNKQLGDLRYQKQKFQNKYDKGEITKEEYEQKMTEIKKQQDAIKIKKQNPISYS